MSYFILRHQRAKRVDGGSKGHCALVVLSASFSGSEEGEGTSPPSWHFSILIHMGFQKIFTEY